MSGCDCVRCQTEGCDDSELCGCCLNAEVERLTTAIQRVQAVCDKPNPGPSWDSYVEGYNDAISVVQAAMEGDADA